MWQTAFLLAAEATQEAPPGGLFDLNATLPLMAIQTVILILVLDRIFYKPFNKVLDERSDYVRDTQLSTQQRLDEAKQLAQQYESDLASTRKQAQAVIAQAQAEAQKIASQQITEAQQDAQKKREQAQTEIEAQKQSALQTLEQQVDCLSDQILAKLLGT